MKVAIIGGRGYQSSYGGVENAIRELSNRMSKQVDVYVYGYEKNHYTGFSSSNLRSNLNVVKLNTVFTSHSVCITLCVLHAIIFKKVDAVFLFASGPCSLLYLCKLFRIPVIACLRAVDSKRDKWSFLARKLLEFGEWSALQFADVVTVNSFAMKTLFEHRRPDIAMIPNGSTFPDEGHDSVLEHLQLKKDKYILFAARLDPVKRLEVLLHAFQKAKTADFKLVVAGGNAKSKLYEEKLKRASSPNVIFLGHLNKAQLDPLVRHCAVFVLPSVVEGMSNSLLSAMAASRCVLCSDIPENSAVVRDQRAVFEKDNVDQLASKLERLIAKEDSRKQIGESLAYRAKNNFDWNRSAEMFVSICKGLDKRRLKLEDSI